MARCGSRPRRTALRLHGDSEGRADDPPRGQDPRNCRLGGHRPNWGAHRRVRADETTQETRSGRHAAAIKPLRDATEGSLKASLHLGSAYEPRRPASLRAARTLQRCARTSSRSMRCARRRECEASVNTRFASMDRLAQRGEEVSVDKSRNGADEALDLQKVFVCAHALRVLTTARRLPQRARCAGRTSATRVAVCRNPFDA